MKLMTNFISASILASSLASFNVPKAFAQDLKPAVQIKKVNSQEALKMIFANYSLSMNLAKVENKQVIFRQAITEAAMKVKSSGITHQDLLNYATADMSPAEAKAFKSQFQSVAIADLNSAEGQALLEKVLMSQSSGAHFLPCGVGFTMALVGGVGALVLGIVALTSLSDVSRTQRQDLQREKAAIESEISILQGEGVAETSYLISSRRAEIVQIDIEHAQLLDDKAKGEKDAVTMGAIAGGLAVAAIVGGLAENNCHY